MLLSGCGSAGMNRSSTTSTPEPPKASVTTQRHLCSDNLRGDELLVVINKQPRQILRCNWRPQDLVRIEPRLLAPGLRRRSKRAKLRKAAATALLAMHDDANAEGIRFYVRSAFRSYFEQSRLYRAKVREHGSNHAARFSAQPGRSQHQLGTAIDVTNAASRWRINKSFARTEAGIWLADNAHRYGYLLSYPDQEEHLTGYAFEPWHFRYIGRAAAQEAHKRGLILEEYLRRCQSSHSKLRCPDDYLGLARR